MPAITPKRSVLIIFLALAFALQPFTIDPFLPAFPKIGADFGVSNALLQFSMTGVTVGMALGQLAAGPFSDAIGRKRPMVVAIALYALGAFLSALSPNMSLFIAARVLMAVGSSGAAVIASGIARDLASGDAMMKLLSKVFWVQGFAPVLAPIIGSQLVAQLDWRTDFNVFGAFAVLVLLLAIFGLRETLATADRKDQIFAGMGARFAHVLQDRSYRGLMLVSVMVTLQLYAYLNLFPFLFFNLLKMDQTTYGIMAATVSFSATGPRIGYVLTLIIAMCLGIGSGIGLLTVGQAFLSTPLLMAFVYLAVIGFGMSGGPSQTLSLAPHGEEAGTAAALMGTTNFAVTSLLSPIYTLLPTSNVLGLGGAYLICFGIALLATLLIVKPALRGAALQ
ncbi:MAG: hypothetical protein RLZ69_474 [Actinomycetota bacterium]